jgi:hypothetical protein
LVAAAEVSVAVVGPEAFVADTGLGALTFGDEEITD